jgi:hypothetical protein
MRSMSYSKREKKEKKMQGEFTDRVSRDEKAGKDIQKEGERG